jgi:hypothetical protein
MLLFCNTDATGNLVSCVYGERIIPQQQYEYFFFLTMTQEEIEQNLARMKVIDRQLVVQ